MKTIFEELTEKHIKCEVCGGETFAMYGGGWDNDRIICCDSACGAEYVFPTSTEIIGEKLQSFTAYTDYPFIFLGDVPDVKAPIREVEVLGYDGEDYCKVLVNGFYTSVRKCFLYKDHGRFGEAEAIDRECFYMLQRWERFNNE